ncbi:hypothetical protein C1646_775601, partial [Rhizophagus diaphanus]
FSFLDYLGYWISASWIIWDIGFQLSGLFGILDFVIPGSLFQLFGLFGILDFGFLDYLGYWISASWIIWDIGYKWNSSMI